MARRVGLKISRERTEFIMVGNWAFPVELCISTGTIKLVKDFKYLGSWLLNCSKDFEIKNALVKIWKSSSVSSAVKIKLFRASVDTTLMYNTITWTLTDTQSKKLNGC
jgi:hypothetical protein